MSGGKMLNTLHNVKKILPLMALLAFVLAGLSCTGGPVPVNSTSANRNTSTTGNNQVTNAETTIGIIQDKDWLLEEVRIGSNTVKMDRTRDSVRNMGDIYSIRFGTDRLSGMAAPNRYFGPYTSGEGNALSIGTVASTRMAPLSENEGLGEREYFSYLNRINRWEFRNGKLELHSSTENGSPVVLSFF
jgi:heat shock protein HslJ